jgi:oligosaccharide repeat unit polymerase
MNTRWQRFFAPEMLFLACTGAALFPYLLWYFGEKLPVVDHLELTYIPVLVWGSGLLSLVVGARIARLTVLSGGHFRISQHSVPAVLVLSIIVVAILVQVYYAVQDVYGVLPLVEYLSNASGVDVGIVNDQQQYSGAGQLGFLTACLFATNALFLVGIFEWVTWRRGSRVLLAILFVVTCLAHLVNAKRGGLYSTLIFLLAGLSIYFGDPVAAVSAMLPRSRALVAKTFLGVLMLLLVLAFGYFGSIRTRGRIEASPQEIISYLQYPLINFETQCAAAGFGPGESKLLGPLRYLTLFKYTEATDAFVATVPRTVRDSPNGIYELIHWCWGLPGVIGFSFLLGFISRWLYDRAQRSLTCLLAYCFLANALLMAHTANQVLILAYVPVPILFVFLLKLLVFTDKIGPRSPIATPPDTLLVTVPQ